MLAYLLGKSEAYIYIYLISNFFYERMTCFYAHWEGSLYSSMHMTRLRYLSTSLFIIVPTIQSIYTTGTYSSNWKNIYRLVLRTFKEALDMEVYHVTCTALAQQTGSTEPLFVQSDGRIACFG